METVENIRQRERASVDSFIKFVNDLPVLSPRQIFDELQRLGYRGQVLPRRVVSLMAYRHLRRIRRIYLDHESRERMMPKINTLFLGPTGCGKTHLVELLFGHILKLPTVVLDVTTYSETGYVGQDPNTILTRLLHVADNNPMLASIGIICLDEFDKLASSQNNAVFAGAGTTKDVTGMGVQRELLKMLDSSEVVVPLELTHSSYGDYAVLSTADIAFIAAGAFSGFPQLLRRRGVSRGIGFGQRTGASQVPLRDDDIAVSLSPDEVEDVSHFQAYGFLPELIARFTRIVPFAALNDETLKEILSSSVLQRLVTEFEQEGYELQVTDAVLDWVVHQSVKRQTGARGLSAILTRMVEDAAFEHFAGDKAHGCVRLVLQGDSVVATAD